MKRVLLVCEAEGVCRRVSATLSALGFGVDIAYDSHTAMYLAGRREYSHVLIDHEIEQSSGIRLYERLSVAQRGALGVLLSSSANVQTVYSAIQAGLQRVVAKPVDFAQLLPLLDLNNQDKAPKDFEATPTMTESTIAHLSLDDIRQRLSVAELIGIIRGVDYPFAGKDRLDHFDRDTLERVVHLVCRWCRQRLSTPVTV